MSFPIHGHSTHGGTPTYRSWQQMRDRCTNTRHHAYRLYGGRGITVCKRWASFKNFLADMGERPKGKTLDRRKNDKGYKPSNCRWATWTEQATNRRGNRLLTYGGTTLRLVEWATRLGIGQNTLHLRLKNGWPLKKAITCPALPHGLRYFGADGPPPPRSIKAQRKLWREKQARYLNRKRLGLVGTPARDMAP